MLLLLIAWPRWAHRTNYSYSGCYHRWWWIQGRVVSVKETWLIAHSGYLWYWELQWLDGYSISLLHSPGFGQFLGNALFSYNNSPFLPRYIGGLWTNMLSRTEKKMSRVSWKFLEFLINCRIKHCQISSVVLETPWKLLLINSLNFIITVSKMCEKGRVLWKASHAIRVVYLKCFSTNFLSPEFCSWKFCSYQYPWKPQKNDLRL